MGHLAHNDPISVPTGSKILEIAIGSAAAHGSCYGSCSREALVNEGLTLAAQNNFHDEWISG
jgi:hypothetical protein